MRLTAEIIASAPAYMNPINQRELSIRGLKVPVIENLGVTLDQYEAIDLSDNEVAKLDNFPLLTRLQNLLLHNNRIAKISEGLGRYLPKLHSLVLTNNKLANFSDIDPLADLPALTHLTLIGNPVAKLPNYRLYIIFKLPQVTILDFNKVKPAEREASKKIFGAPAKQLTAAQRRLRDQVLKKQDDDDGKMEDDRSSSSAAAAPASVSTFVPGEGLSKEQLAERRAKILDAIKSATSLEEVERLEKILQSGNLSQF